MVRIIQFLPMIHIAEHIDAQTPDFKNGATPFETARYYRQQGDILMEWGNSEGARLNYNKAKHALQLSTWAAARTLFVLTPAWVGGYKEPGNKVSFIGLHTVGTHFGEEVKVHEWIHNTQESKWDELTIPGYQYMTDARKWVIYGKIGMSNALWEREMIEWLTQYATQQKVSGTISSYDKFEVPESLYFFRVMELKSWKKMIGAFLNMALNGSSAGKAEFAAGMRIGWNIFLLEQALKNTGFDAAKHAQAMSKVIEAQKDEFVIRDINQARELADSYIDAISLLPAEANELALAA